MHSNLLLCTPNGEWHLDARRVPVQITYSYSDMCCSQAEHRREMFYRVINLNNFSQAQACGAHLSSIEDMPLTFFLVRNFPELVIHILTFFESSL